MGGDALEGAGDRIPALPPRKTLNGKFDAYCRTCWNAVYVLWVDKEDHGGVCPFGHIKAHECPDARQRAELQAFMAHMKREGHLT